MTSSCVGGRSGRIIKLRGLYVAYATLHAVIALPPRARGGSAEVSTRCRPRRLVAASCAGCLRRIRHAVARVALSASRAGRRNRAEAPLEYLQERCYRVDCDGGGDDDDVDDVDADDDDDVDLW